MLCLASRMTNTRTARDRETSISYVCTGLGLVRSLATVGLYLAVSINEQMNATGFFVICVGLIAALSGQAEGGSYGNENEATQSETDGKLYEMSIWSRCSRTCGIGIKFRGLLCLREHRAICKDERREYATCNTQDCPLNSPDFRHVQCARYNDKDIFVSGGRGQWAPHPIGKRKCRLYCHPVGQGLYYYFGRAKDGTQCADYPYSICVHAKCKPVGCDKVLGSGVYEDKCGVCGGNNTSCRLRQGQISKQPTYLDRSSGYTHVLVIPKGATNVLVSDTTRNYLAVTKREHGGYIFNGNRILSRPKTFGVGKMKLTYERSKDRINETIRIHGPTTEDLHIMVLLVTSPVSCTFEYWLPKSAEETQAFVAFNEAQDTASNILMEWGAWTSCSVSCGSGIRVRARQCEGGPNASCLDAASQIDKCHNRPCGPHWSEWSPWNACSASCGMGVRIRFRRCIRPRISVRATCPGSKYKVDYCNVFDCPDIVLETTTAEPPLETGATTESTGVTSEEPSAPPTNTSGVEPSTAAQESKTELPGSQVPDQREKHESSKGSSAPSILYKPSTVPEVEYRKSSALQRPLVSQSMKLIAETTAGVNRELMNKTERTASTRKVSHAARAAPSVSSTGISVYSSIRVVTHPLGVTTGPALVGIMSSQLDTSSPESHILLKLGKTAFVYRTAHLSSSNRSGNSLETSTTHRSSHRPVTSSSRSAHMQSPDVAFQGSFTEVSAFSSGLESLPRMRSISEQTFDKSVNTYLSTHKSEATSQELAATKSVSLIKDERMLTKFQITSSLSSHPLIYSTIDTPYMEVAASIRSTVNTTKSKITQSSQSFNLAESNGLPRRTKSIIQREMKMSSDCTGKEHMPTKALASSRMPASHSTAVFPSKHEGLSDLLNSSISEESLRSDAFITHTLVSHRPANAKESLILTSKESASPSSAQAEPSVIDKMLTYRTNQSEYTSYSRKAVQCTSQSPTDTSYMTQRLPASLTKETDTKESYVYKTHVENRTLHSKHRVSTTATITSDVPVFDSYTTAVVSSVRAVSKKLSETVPKEVHSGGSTIIHSLVSTPATLGATSVITSKEFIPRASVPIESSYVGKIANQTSSKQPKTSVSTSISSAPTHSDKTMHPDFADKIKTHRTRIIPRAEESTVGVSKVTLPPKPAASKEISTTGTMQAGFPVSISRTHKKYSGSRGHSGTMPRNTSSPGQVSAKFLVSKPATLDASVMLTSEEFIPRASTPVESPADGKQPTVSVNTVAIPAVHVMLTTNKPSSVQADSERTKAQTYTTRIRITKAEERTVERSEMPLSSSKEPSTTAAVQVDSLRGLSISETHTRTSANNEERAGLSHNTSSPAQVLENISVTSSMSIFDLEIIHQSSLVSTKWDLQTASNPVTEVSAALSVMTTRINGSYTTARRKAMSVNNMHNSSKTALPVSMNLMPTDSILSENPTSRAAGSILVSPTTATPLFLTTSTELSSARSDTDQSTHPEDSSKGQTRTMVTKAEESTVGVSEMALSPSTTSGKGLSIAKMTEVVLERSSSVTGVQKKPSVYTEMQPGGFAPNALSSSHIPVDAHVMTSSTSTSERNHSVSFSPVWLAQTTSSPITEEISGTFSIEPAKSIQLSEEQVVKNQISSQATLLARIATIQTDTRTAGNVTFRPAGRLLTSLVDNNTPYLSETPSLRFSTSESVVPQESQLYVRFERTTAMKIDNVKHSTTVGNTRVHRDTIIVSSLLPSQRVVALSTDIMTCQPPVASALQPVVLSSQGTLGNFPENIRTAMPLKSTSSAMMTSLASVAATGSRGGTKANKTSIMNERKPNLSSYSSQGADDSLLSVSYISHPSRYSELGDVPSSQFYPTSPKSALLQMSDSHLGLRIKISTTRWPASSSSSHAKGNVTDSAPLNYNTLSSKPDLNVLVSSHSQLVKARDAFVKQSVTTSTFIKSSSTTQPTKNVYGSLLTEMKAAPISTEEAKPGISSSFVQPKMQSFSFSKALGITSTGSVYSKVLEGLTSNVIKSTKTSEVMHSLHISGFASVGAQSSAVLEGLISKALKSLATKGPLDIMEVVPMSTMLPTGQSVTFRKSVSQKYNQVFPTTRARPLSASGSMYEKDKTPAAIQSDSLLPIITFVTKETLKSVSGKEYVPVSESSTATRKMPLGQKRKITVKELPGTSMVVESTSRDSTRERPATRHSFTSTSNSYANASTTPTAIRVALSSKAMTETESGARGETGKVTLTARPMDVFRSVSPSSAFVQPKMQSFSFSKAGDTFINGSPIRPPTLEGTSRSFVIEKPLTQIKEAPVSTEERKPEIYSSFEQAGLQSLSLSKIEGMISAGSVYSKVHEGEISKVLKSKKTSAVMQSSYLQPREISGSMHAFLSVGAQSSDDRSKAVKLTKTSAVMQSSYLQPREIGGSVHAFLSVGAQSSDVRSKAVKLKKTSSVMQSSYLQPREIGGSVHAFPSVGAQSSEVRSKAVKLTKSSAVMQSSYLQPREISGSVHAFPSAGAQSSDVRKGSISKALKSTKTSEATRSSYVQPKHQPRYTEAPKDGGSVRQSDSPVVQNVLLSVTSSIHKTPPIVVSSYVLTGVREGASKQTNSTAVAIVSSQEPNLIERASTKDSSMSSIFNRTVASPSVKAALPTQDARLDASVTFAPPSMAPRGQAYSSTMSSRSVDRNEAAEIPTTSSFVSSTTISGLGDTGESARTNATVALHSTRGEQSISAVVVLSSSQGITINPSITKKSIFGVSSSVRNDTSTVIPTTVTEECPPCKPLRKRRKMYCLSDYVLQIEVRYESPDEFTHDTTYYVRVKDTFKSKVALKEKTQILVSHDKCRCPELHPRSEYLVMGHMSDQSQAEDKPALRLNRQSYFQPWKASMMERLKGFKDMHCPDQPTTASVQSSPKPALTDKVPTKFTIPTTNNVTCKPCRPSKKRNKSFCESDFVLRVMILKESYNVTSVERSYSVRIKGSFKPGHQLHPDDRIWTTNAPPVCKCPDFQLKTEYVIMGNLASQPDGQEPRLTIGPRSFVRVWKDGMKRGLESLDGVCKKQVACSPCRPSNKRNKDFCESDFVLQVKILKESYNVTSGDRSYSVRIKGSFKPGRPFNVKNRIWTTNTPPACKCPDFQLKTEYVIMGNLASQPDGQEPRLTIGPRSFVRVWEDGMKIRLESLDGGCKN